MVEEMSEMPELEEVYGGTIAKLIVWACLIILVCIGVLVGMTFGG